MSNQSYYKDRLGFDPNEAALYDGNGSPIKGGDRYTSTPVRQAHKHHYGNGNGTPDRYQSPGRGGNDSHDGTPSKKSKQQQQQTQYSSSSLNNSSYLSESQNQSVYEESLTQFKGTMSLWEHFVDNWDILGTYCNAKEHSRPKVCALNGCWRRDPPWSCAGQQLEIDLVLLFCVWEKCSNGSPCVKINKRALQALNAVVCIHI